MAIIGIEALVYGVENVEESARFFDDFGLVRSEEDGADGVAYALPEGSRVLVLPRDDARFAASAVEGSGVQEVIWGVSDQAALDRLVRDLSSDLDVTVDARGIARFVTPFGIAMGLRVFARRPFVSATDPLNSPGNPHRVNQPRRWRLRARPKVISHLVYEVPGYEAAADFMCRRLGFRMSDVQRNFGRYLRAAGSNSHHNILLLNADAPIPGMNGKLNFHHSNFGVDDIDELMIGANHMTRKGWEASHWGLGRHRIDSGLFYYIPSPAGGEVEYGADADVLDDSWVPRFWINPLFGFAHFVSNMPPFFMDSPDWNFRYIVDGKAPLDSEPLDA